MDNPEIDPEKYQVSLHSYLSPTQMLSPSSWGDVGHAFVSISKGGKIIGSAGLAPDQTQEQQNWTGGAAFWQTMNYTVQGKIYSEWSSLFHHTGMKGEGEGNDVHVDDHLRTKTWDISEEQALKFMDYVSDQRRGKNVHKTYNLYRDNCTDWALGALEHIDVDVSMYKGSSYVRLPRPGTFHSKLPDKGTGTLVIPKENELRGKLKNNDPPWVSDDGYRIHEQLKFNQEKAKAQKLEEQRLAKKEEPEQNVPQKSGKKKTPSLGFGS